MKKKIRLTESELTDLIKNVVSETKDKPNGEYNEAISSGTKTKDCKKDSDCPSGMYCAIGRNGVDGLCKYKDELSNKSTTTTVKEYYKENSKNKIRLTESELTDLIKSVVVETKRKQRISEQTYIDVPETADAIYTIIGTTIGLLGIAGYDILKQYAKELMSNGKKKEAREIMSAIKDMQSKGEGELGEGIEPGNCKSTCSNPCKWSSYWQEKCGCKCKPEMK